MAKYRYFTHIDKFNDSTRYLRTLGKKRCWLISRDHGITVCNAYDLGMCLRSVKRGNWKEISQWQASRIK